MHDVIDDKREGAIEELARANMTNAVELALVGGDLSRLNSEQRLTYYNRVCESVGLNPLTRPFEYITLNSKLTLYAKKDCTDQLRKIHGVSVTIVSRELLEGAYVVCARATLPDGRTDESIGAVYIGNAKGDAYANTLMKAETKAKRRVTLSICGLGFLDETEVQDIPRHEKPVPAKPLPKPSGPRPLKEESKEIPFEGPKAVIGEKPVSQSATRLIQAGKEKGWANSEIKLLLRIYCQVDKAEELDDLAMANVIRILETTTPMEFKQEFFDHPELADQGAPTTPLQP